jgi:hypothetical protein
VSFLEPALPSLLLSLAYSRDLHPALFHVFARDEALFPSLSVRMFVIGASSLVLVEAPHVSLAEVITCSTSPDFPRLASACVPASTGAAAHASCCAGSYRYQARLSAAPPDAYEGQSLERVLEYRFPGPGEPRTRVEAGIASGELVIRTLHDYPEVGITLRSESRWSFPGGKSPG